MHIFYDLYCHLPLQSELSLHMQLLCLSHGAHVTPEVANQIVAVLKCDIRKAVTLLHFWLTLQLPSNGGSDTSSEPSATVGGKLTVEDRGVGEILVGGPNEAGRRGISVAPLSLEHLLGMSSVQREVLRRVFMETETTGLLGSEVICYDVLFCDTVQWTVFESLYLSTLKTGGIQLVHLHPPI